MDVRFHDADRRLSQRARRLLGSKTGIVSDLLCYLPDRADPDVFYSTGVESTLDPVVGIRAGALEAGGTALDSAGALMSTIGETAERYCLYFPDRSTLIEASHRELSRTERVVDYDYVAVFDEDQYERIELDPVEHTTEICWQPATDLLSGEDVYVPAQWVWMGLAGGDTLYYPTTSNGCACGDSPASALVGALSEYVERDAIMRTWFRREPTRPIELDGESEVAEIVARRFETDVLSIRFFEMDSVIGIPLVGCAAVDTRDRAPKFVVGGASSLDRRTAYTDALVEVAQTWVYLKDLLARDGARDGLDPEHIYDLTDNLLFYALPENYGDVEFLLGDGQPAAPTLGEGPDDAAAELEAYLDLCRDAGVTPLAVDVTTSDIGDVGFTVTRVVVPELIDLALPSLPPATHPVFAGEELTDKPHPYP